MTNPLRDMEEPDVIFCIGTNMTECHPVAATRIKKAHRKGAIMIVADPRKIPLTKRADMHLQLKVGTDVALLLGMAHVIAREGLVDEAFMQDRTLDGAAFLEHVKAYPPEWAESICGVPAADIERAALAYARGKKGAIFYTLGITEHICGVDNVQSLCNLALMTGHIGREGTGINPMRGQNNIQGAGDAGGLPNNYVGFQPVDDPVNQAHFSKLYGRQIDLERGITKVRALDYAADGKMKAMLICGENTLVSDPDRHHCEKALRNLDHLVVVDIFLTETAELADVVLPASAWAETDGVFTNTERRIQRVRAAVPAQGEAKPEWWIMSELAKRQGVSGFDYESAEDVFNELCDNSATYKGVNWDRAGEGTYQWPVPSEGHPGTYRLHEDDFPTATGRGTFKRVEYREPAEVVDDDYPVWLTTGRRLQHYHTRTMTGRAGMHYFVPEETLEVHPADASAWGLADGARVRMASKRGVVELAVEVTDRSPRGTVFCSFGFGDTRINDLTGAGYDPITETAELKVCPVRLDVVPAE